MTLENLNKANQYAKGIEDYSRQLEALEKLPAWIEVRVMNEGTIMSIDISRDSKHEHASLAAAFVMALENSLIEKIADLKIKITAL